MPVGRPTTYDPAYCDAVIELMREGKSRAQVSSVLGVHRETLNNWEKSHPEFFDALKVGTELAQAWWEDRAQKATFDCNGFNATAYIFTMKNRFREDYPDTQRNEVTGKNGDPLTILLSEIADQPSSSPMSRLRAEDDD